MYKNRLAFLWLASLLMALLLNRPIPLAAQTEPPVAVPINADEIANFLDEFLPGQMTELDVPGVGFVLVNDDEVLFARGYGWADREQGIAFDPATTIVRAGSLVKGVTALALIQLAEAGAIDLDEDINQYLTVFQLPDTYPEPITARQLLHYTGGLDGNFLGIRATKREDLLPLADYLTEHPPSRVRPPGQVRAYNDQEIALAALLVEEVSGQSYSDYVGEHIFTPLGMADSSLLLPVEDEGRAAVGYGSAGPYPDNFYFLHDAPGAGFNTTVLDMARYLQAHLGGNTPKNGRLLSLEGMTELHTTRFRHHPELPGIAYTLDEQSWGDSRILAKSGGAPGFQNRMLLFPEEKLGLYFVYNRDSTVPLRQRLEQAFLERFFPQASNGELSAEKPMVTSQLQHYTGFYIDLNDYSSRTIEKVQRLFEQERVTLDGQGGLTIFGRSAQPIGDHLFQWRERGSIVAFAADDQERASHFFVSRTAFQHLPWYESFPVQIGLLIFALLTFLLGLVLFTRAVRIRQAGVYALAGSVSLLNLGFLIGLGLLLAPVFAGADPPWSLSFAPSPALLILLALPLVSVLLLVSLLVQSTWDLMAGRGKLHTRLFNLCVLCGGATFLYFLHTWNLLGYRL